MRAAAHSFGLIWAGSASDAVHSLAAQGFDAIELIAAPGHLDPWENIDAAAAPVVDALNATGARVIALDLVAHDVNLASLFPEVRRFSLDAYERLIDLTLALGAGWTTVHGGRRIGFNPPPGDLEWQQLRASIDRLSALAGKRGVRLLIENIPIGLLSTADAMRRFVEEGGWSNVDLAYDLTNAVAAGDDIAQALATHLSHFSVLHLSDAPIGKHRHDPVGQGDVDFAALARTPGLADYGGWGVVEIVAENLDMEIARSRDALAAAGWNLA